MRKKGPFLGIRIGFLPLPAARLADAPERPRQVELSWVPVHRTFGPDAVIGKGGP